jgi:glucose/arabinose dehydrogenase
MKKQIIAVVVISALAIGILIWNTNRTSVESVARPTDTSLADQGTLTLVERTLTFEDGSTAVFRLPKEFNIAVAAEGLGKARFMAQSADGRIFIPDMINWNLSHEGKMYILGGWDPQAKKFATTQIYLTKLRGPNDVAFYTDTSGKNWIYYTITEGLFRNPYNAGDTTPSGSRELVYSFPNKQSPGADGIVWHVTRTVLFDGDTLYVSVGSGCNLCEQVEGDMRAQILVMNPDGTNVRTYADGIKNAVGIALADGALYATENGVDHLGDEAPDDVMFKVVPGAHHGWPYCYETAGQKLDETNKSWKRKTVDCADVPMSFVSFGPHTAPLGVTYFKNAHPLLQNTFLVALHGSHKPELKYGYKLVRVMRDGSEETFMDGFMTASGERVARPVHILQADENSFYLSDDFGGRVFYIYATEA